MKSCAILTLFAFVVFLTQQWLQVSASGQYSEENGPVYDGCLNYEKCCYYANEYYYKCVAAGKCGRGNPYYCAPFYDTCSTAMQLNAPDCCKLCLSDYYYLSAGMGCACCTDANYCDSFEYTPKPYYD